MTILVFDSGIGGLGVVAQIRALQPAAPLTYLADNACFPYGGQPDDALTARILTLIGTAIDTFNPAAIVIACNTASTIALGPLRAAYATPFIGCVPPIKPAAAASRSRHVGLLATAATTRRQYLNTLIATHAANCTIHSLATPTLAALAEQKFRGHPINPATLAAATAPLFAQPGATLIDSIALGCTHYTFLLPELRALYPAITFFDPAPAVARQTLATTQITPTAPLTRNPATAYFTAPPPDLEDLQPRLTNFGFSSTGIIEG